MKKIANRTQIETAIRQADFQSYFSSDISDITEMIHAKAGETLIHEGVPSRYLFFIVSGQCRYFSLSSSGFYVSFGVSRNYRFCGEASSLWGGKPTSSVQAITDTTCLAIDLHKHRELLQNDILFLQYNCRALTEMVNNLDSTLSTYVGGKLSERLAAFILQNSVDDVFSVSLVAATNALGTSYRHLQRVMKSFCQQGVLRKEKRRYYITDAKALREMASDDSVYFY
jgi:CRP-like cAMP-binding protein